MGAIRFAQETNQTLTDFFSEDSAKVGASAIDKSSNLKHIAKICRKCFGISHPLVQISI